MKCYEVTRCSEQDRVNCYVWNNFHENPADMENLKCWVLKGSYLQENKAQAQKCQVCKYYAMMNREGGVASDHDSELVIVSCTGTINSQRTWALERVWDTLKQGKKYKVLLDVVNVNNIYSCGLSVFVKIHREAQELGGKLIIAGARDYVDQLFFTTKLSKILTIVPDRATAVTLFDADRRKKEAAAAHLAAEEAKKQAEASKPKAPAPPRHEPVKWVPCWEHWKDHNPRNATKCSECFHKLNPQNRPCWIVEGIIEGVSFQYVNEECAPCDYFEKYSAAYQV